MSTVKILVVTDDDGGFRRSNTWAHKFHIGEVVKVWSETDWQGFTIEITRATREHDPAPATPSASHPIGADVYDFRFTDAALAGFDIALFFSIASKGEDPVTADSERQAEAAAIARFMEQGGGFFATGDHEDLGASICQHVPRVRSMRRWAYPSAGPHGGAVAPSGIGADRHDTLQAGTDTGSSGGVTYPYQFNDQSDALPQPIKVVSYLQSRSRWFLRSLPHPLLCSPLGRIDVLPDHMHEGWCEVPDNLTRAEDLPGRDGKDEYPTDGDGVRLAPEVIAMGRVLQHATNNQEFGGSFAVSPTTSSERDFGVIAAYDGYKTGVGRAVVDSTWHHFVNINLIGTDQSFAGLNASKAAGYYSGPGGTAVPAYEKIKWYYRNLIYWLIPKNRIARVWISELLRAARENPRWEEFGSSRFQVEKIDLRRLIGFGQLADEYFRKTRGFCVTLKLLPVILYPIWRFDPHIWEKWAPDIDPWDVRVQKLAGDIDPLPEWRQALLPDGDLRRLILLGTLVLAAVEQVPKLDRLDDRAFDRIQARTLQLLPRSLELAAHEVETSLAASKALQAELTDLAHAVRGMKGQAGA